MNPQQNPYAYSNGKGAHENAHEFWSRDVSKRSREIDRASFIGNDTEIYHILKKIRLDLERRLVLRKGLSAF